MVSGINTSVARSLHEVHEINVCRADYACPFLCPSVSPHNFTPEQIGGFA
jgi:hypothetical protein